MQSDAPGLITTAAAARRLGVIESTVRTLIRSGELTGHRVGRVVRVDPDSVDAFLERSKIGGGTS